MDLLTLLNNVPTGEVTLRGQKVRVTCLLDDEEAAIRAAFEPPVVPMKPQEGKGSLSPKVPDFGDAKFQEASRQWDRRTNRALAWAMIDGPVNGGSWSGGGKADPKAYALGVEAANIKLLRMEVEMILAAAKNAILGSPSGAKDGGAVLTQGEAFPAAAAEQE